MMNIMDEVPKAVPQQAPESTARYDQDSEVDKEILGDLEDYARQYLIGEKDKYYSKVARSPDLSFESLIDKIRYAKAAGLDILQLSEIIAPLLQSALMNNVLYERQFASSDYKPEIINPPPRVQLSQLLIELEIGPELLSFPSDEKNFDFKQRKLERELRNLITQVLSEGTGSANSIGVFNPNRNRYYSKVEKGAWTPRQNDVTGADIPIFDLEEETEWLIVFLKKVRDVGIDVSTLEVDERKVTISRFLLEQWLDISSDGGGPWTRMSQHLRKVMYYQFKVAKEFDLIPQSREEVGLTENFKLDHDTFFSYFTIDFPDLFPGFYYENIYDQDLWEQGMRRLAEKALLAEIFGLSGDYLTVTNNQKSMADLVGIPQIFRSNEEAQHFTYNLQELFRKTFDVLRRDWEFGWNSDAIQAINIFSNRAQEYGLKEEVVEQYVVPGLKKLFISIINSQTEPIFIPDNTVIAKFYNILATLGLEEQPLFDNEFEENFELKRFIIDEMVLYIGAEPHNEYRKKSFYNFIKLFKIADPMVSEILSRALLMRVERLKITGLDQFAEDFNFPQNLSEYKQLSPFLYRFYTNWQLENFAELGDFVAKNIDYFNYLRRERDPLPRLGSGDLPVVKALHLDLVEAEILKRNGTDLQNIESEGDFETLFRSLSMDSDEWSSISSSFEAAAAVFGFKRMFEYASQRKKDEETHEELLTLRVKRHDAFHYMDAIIDIYRNSGLSPDAFWGNILAQVSKDTSTYSAGTSYHHLNEVANTLNPDFQETLDEAKRFSGIKQLQELLVYFDSAAQIFESWKNLQRFSKLQQLVRRNEILPKLQLANEQGKTALCRYLEILAFHPDSKIDMDRVWLFFENPAAFLQLEASHTPRKIHDRKKPSNFVELPNLDLEPEELRDALVEGHMDALQAFRPFEIRYTVGSDGYEQPTIRALMSEALGSYKDGIEGKASNAKKLFSELKIVFKRINTNVGSFLQDETLEISPELERELTELIYHPEFGMVRPQVPTKKVIVKITRKSDPHGVVAGNDAANCMPFGDGKNNVYMFNPNNVHFLVRIEKAEGGERTIAQSVLHKDMDVGVLIPDVIEQLQGGHNHLIDILPETILDDSQAYIAADNLEAASNYSGEEFENILEIVMRDFFREYLSRFAEEERLDSSVVPIGMNYTNVLNHLPTRPNTFAPQAPVSYSDNTRDESYAIELHGERHDRIMDREVIEPNHERPKPRQWGPNIKELTFQDALKVGYLEGKAYADNASLMEYLFNMENALIAKDINNAVKSRPNLSLKYVDNAGRMRGYLLAWEGRLTDQGASGLEEYGKPVIYLSDLATDKQTPMAWARMVDVLLQMYEEYYINSGNMIPIFMQARETTSYSFLKAMLGRLTRKIVVEFEMVELEAYEVGEDTMHPLLIRPVRKV